MALLGFGNLASTLGGMAPKGNTASTGLSVTNNPGFSVAGANPYTFTENLGGMDSATRKGYYQAGDFSQLPALMNEKGLNLGQVVTDYNAQMGTNINPVDAAIKIYGFSPQQVAQVVTSGNQQLIADTANKLGIDATSLTNWSNNYFGTSHTPEGTTAYLTQGPSTTSNLMDLGLNATGPSSHSSSGGGGSSFSGMDWSKSPVSFEQLQQLAADLPNLANQYSATSYNRYAKMLRDALGDKGNFAGVFNSLSGRNMSGSSVASDAIGNAMMGITKDIGDKAYASDIAGLNAQMQVPKTLADIANLGQITQQSNSNWSSTIQDPGTLQNYEVLVGLLGGNMFT